MWKLLDRQGEWIRRHFPPQNQIRLGVILIWIGVLSHVYMWFTDEPAGIAQMSAFAILVGGFGFVVTAVLAKNTEETAENTEDTAEAVQNCRHCGKDPCREESLPQV